MCRAGWDRSGLSISLIHPKDLKDLKDLPMARLKDLKDLKHMSI